MDKYELVKLVSFTFVNWSDIYRLYEPVENFDAVKLMSLSWVTPSTGNNTMELVLTSNSEWNKGVSVTPSGQISNYFYKTTLDPRSDVGIYVENINPPYVLSGVVPQWFQFRYELLINGAPNDADISSSSPVYVEIGFFKKL
jgi:hypothetical protein